jgi:ParB/RepB/Spo0J family partition protein
VTVSAAAVPQPASVVEVAVDALVIGDDYRIDDDLDSLAELAASIAEHGILQPLLVRQTDAGWEVVAGRRRLAAARTAGLTTVPCVLRVLSDDEAADAALAENLHRRDLSAVEEALAYSHLRDRGLNQTQIARRAGRSQSHVSTLLRVLELPGWLRERVHRREMSYVTALDRWGRKSRAPRGGGAGTHGTSGPDFDLVNHWRRRHDRLLAGIHALHKARPREVPEYRMMIDRLIKLDGQPLPEQTR